MTDAYVHACPLQAHLLVSGVKAGACVQTSDRCHLCMKLRLDLDHPFSTCRTAKTTRQVERRMDITGDV